MALQLRLTVTARRRGRSIQMSMQCCDVEKGDCPGGDNPHGHTNATALHWTRVHLDNAEDVSWTLVVGTDLISGQAMCRTHGARLGALTRRAPCPLPAPCPVQAFVWMRIDESGSRVGEQLPQPSPRGGRSIALADCSPHRGLHVRRDAVSASFQGHSPSPRAQTPIARFGCG